MFIEFIWIGGSKRRQIDGGVFSQWLTRNNIDFPLNCVLSHLYVIVYLSVYRVQSIRWILRTIVNQAADQMLVFVYLPHSFPYFLWFRWFGSPQPEQQYRDDHYHQDENDCGWYQECHKDVRLEIGSIFIIRCLSWCRILGNNCFLCNNREQKRHANENSGCNKKYNWMKAAANGCVLCFPFG